MRAAPIRNPGAGSRTSGIGAAATCVSLPTMRTHSPGEAPRSHAVTFVEERNRHDQPGLHPLAFVALAREGRPAEGSGRAPGPRRAPRGGRDRQAADLDHVRRTDAPVPCEAEASCERCAMLPLARRARGLGRSSSTSRRVLHLHSRRAQFSSWGRSEDRDPAFAPGRATVRTPDDASD
jgi:hypothetical protein